MLRTLPRTTRLRIAALVVATAGATIVAGALLIRDRSATVPNPASLEAAVALGILDQEVLDAVRVDGEAVGIVSIETRQILVGVRSRFPDAAQQAEALEAGLRLIEAAKEQLTEAIRDRAVIELDFDHLSNIAVRFRDEDSLLLALRLPVVSAIRANRTGQTTMEESRRLVRQSEAVQGHGGAGTYVAVLDTGVDAGAYPAYFATGSVASTFAAGDANGSALRYGHGTHVASTVLGIAPETRIIGVDVFRWDWWQLLGPTWSTERVLAGINHVTALKRAYLKDSSQCCNVVAMNLSLGMSGEYHRATCPDDFSFGPALLAGIIPVVSSGNDALERNDTFTPGVGYPACAQASLSVGATTDGAFANVPDRCEASAGVDRLTSFSQTGPTLQILAPGNCIVAAGGAMQGTSMAAPHVAGAIAVLASARPTASASEIWAALTESGAPISDSRFSAAATARRLDIAAAVERILATAPGATASPGADRSAPLVRPPEAVISSGPQAQPDGRMSITVAWSADDDGLVARYSLRQRIGGADWTTVALPRPDATSTSLTLAPGSTYQFGVSAEDTAGKTSEWVEGPEIAFDALRDVDPSVAYTGTTWVASASGEALGGSAQSATGAGAEACLTFTGRYVAWIATRSPSRGVAGVWLDGRQVATIDLGTASAPRSVAYSRPVDGDGSHVLCVRAEGTAGRPTIDVDGFAILR